METQSKSYSSKVPSKLSKFRSNSVSKKTDNEPKKFNFSEKELLLIKKRHNNI